MGKVLVKAHWAEKEEVTAWGGLALAERLAHRTRLWSDCRKLMPSRTRTDAGYDSTAVVSAMIHGLLSGSTSPGPFGGSTITNRRWRISSRTR